MPIGDEELGTVLSYRDVTPLGHQETWEDAPKGYPQTRPYEWWNSHDNFGAEDPPNPEWVKVFEVGTAIFQKQRNADETSSNTQRLSEYQSCANNVIAMSPEKKFNGNAEDAARFYEQTFPGCSIAAITEDQAETDRYWHAIVDDGGSEGDCGWCKDRFGLSWQIVRRALMGALKSSNRAVGNRAMEAMMQMKKSDIAKIEAAEKGLTRGINKSDD